MQFEHYKKKPYLHHRDQAKPNEEELLIAKYCVPKRVNCAKLSDTKVGLQIAMHVNAGNACSWIRREF